MGLLFLARAGGGIFTSLRGREGCVEAREEIQEGVGLKLEPSNSPGEEQIKPTSGGGAGRQCSQFWGGCQSDGSAEGKERSHRLIAMSLQAKVQE